MTAEPTLVNLDRHIFSVGEVSWTPGPLQPASGPVCLVFEPREFETYVMTGIASGNVRVWSEVLASGPPVVAEGWEDVAEVSLKVRSGPLRAMGIGGRRDTRCAWMGTDPVTTGCGSTRTVVTRTTTPHASTPSRTTSSSLGPSSPLHQRR